MIFVTRELKDTEYYDYLEYKICRRYFYVDSVKENNPFRTDPLGDLGDWIANLPSKVPPEIVDKIFNNSLFYIKYVKECKVYYFTTDITDVRPVIDYIYPSSIDHKSITIHEFFDEVDNSDTIEIITRNISTDFESLLCQYLENYGDPRYVYKLSMVVKGSRY